VVEAYVQAGSKIGVLVEVGCETDFVARTGDFRDFARTVALQVAANRNLQYVSEAEVSDELRTSELEIYRARARAEGKPEQILDRIAEGQWKKTLQDLVLLGQPSIRPEHDGRTIEDLRAEVAARLGENVEVKRFARFEVGSE
jgi:elongation factor Ts